MLGTSALVMCGSVSSKIRHAPSNGVGHAFIRNAISPARQNLTTARLVEMSSFPSTREAGARAICNTQYMCQSESFTRVRRIHYPRSPSAGSRSTAIPARQRRAPRHHCSSRQSRDYPRGNPSPCRSCRRFLHRMIQEAASLRAQRSASPMKTAMFLRCWQAGITFALFLNGFRRCHGIAVSTNQNSCDRRLRSIGLRTQRLSRPGGLSRTLACADAPSRWTRA